MSARKDCKRLCDVISNIQDTALELEALADVLRDRCDDLAQNEEVDTGKLLALTWTLQRLSQDVLNRCNEVV